MLELVVWRRVCWKADVINLDFKSNRDAGWLEQGSRLDPSRLLTQKRIRDEALTLPHISALYQNAKKVELRVKILGLYYFWSCKSML